ncbi:MAG: TlpA disulfide reductase family protein [Bryobacteraceae bacterium]|jgi:thiol-disulfide isomerase/thioredoxin
MPASPNLSQASPWRRAALATFCAVAWLAAISCNYVPSYRAKTLGGEQFTSESLKGSVVLVEFWTTWCPYCRQEQPSVDAIERRYYGRGLMVLAVDVGEPKEKVAAYLRRSPRRCRVVASEDTNLVEVLGSQGFPSYVLIGRDGRVAGRQSGARGEESLRHLLAKAGLDAE